MTTNNEQELQADSQIKNCDKATPKQRASLWCVSNLIASIALALAGISFYLTTQFQQYSHQEAKAQQELLNTLTQHQKELTDQFSLDHAKLTKATTDLDERLVAFNQELLTLQNGHNINNQDWLLLKARYYIELAQINDHWSTDTHSTQAMLEQASLALGQLKSKDLFTLRQSLEKNILQFKTATSVDTPGLLSQLDALRASVEQLNTKPMLNDNKTQAKRSQKTLSDLSWKERMQESLNFLSTLVVVRHHDNAIEPLVPPAVEVLLKQSINLNIQEAQWAVLNQNNREFQWALEQALSTLQKNFNNQLTNTTQISQQINNLKEKTLTEEKINLDETLALINHVIDERKDNPVSSAQSYQEQKQ